MRIRDIMSESVEILSPQTTLQQAADKMRKLSCGFLPVHDGREEKLIGVVTDRDLVVRAMAEGLDPTSTKVENVVSDRVHYCFVDDDLENAAGRMKDSKIYRLVVLDNPNDKQLCGIVSLGDLLRHGKEAAAASAAAGIMKAA